MTRTYDPKCFELAEQFVPDKTPHTKTSELAAGIQDYIEDWLSYEQRELELRHQVGDQRLP